jgi:hypothetical protein
MARDEDEAKLVGADRLVLGEWEPNGLHALRIAAFAQETDDSAVYGAQQRHRADAFVDISKD